MKPAPNDIPTNLSSPLEGYTNWRGGLKAKIHAAQQEQMASADNWFTLTLKSRIENVDLIAEINLNDTQIDSWRSRETLTSYKTASISLKAPAYDAN